MSRCKDDCGVTRFVKTWAHDRSVDYGLDLRGPLKDLLHGGCIAGTCGDLVWTHDIYEFYGIHFARINELVEEWEEAADQRLDNGGLDGITARTWFAVEFVASIVLAELETEN